ncbi:prepilin-type N-terminal cleavage/methylation domain-containing protein [Arthrobacter sp. A2-55]|uniref:prepilin-type N-terminal cleavage/methylation domain-containing protein n=1 Tax=Arthrobacter sp. A2-55 TaxID=2897337 RepID=UPI0021CD7F57|nr:prepilin-type N-terminal cleavage/methylation domain-containing protein [Arthrobacter sp. A2-55]MCU6480149.1 prepilin-type N-terminal cleavage/methylation domain-containing protein [Arthrobacter sp. A2-55]
MRTTLTKAYQLLDPTWVHHKIIKRDGSEKESRRDAGFSLIEIMAGMAIIAILALAIIPQFSKFFERAAVQNLSQEVSNAALLVDSDHSLSGKAIYAQADITGSAPSSAAAIKAQLQTGHALQFAITADTTGYTIVGYSPDVKNYKVTYASNGSQPGLSVTQGTQTALTGTTVVTG